MAAAAPVLLDGAMGTALIARGLAPDAFPEEWLLSRPEEIAAVHAAHAAAGATVLFTCTFNLAAPRLERRVPAAQWAALAPAAVRQARAAGSGPRVAGALGPSGPHGPGPAPDAAALEARYARAAGALAAAGVDLLWLESQWDPAEARLALAGARRSGLPVALTFTLVAEHGRLRGPGGAPAEALLEGAEDGGAAATGVNCVAADDALAALAAWAGRRLRIPFVAKPSPGLPGAVLSPAAFAAALRPALEAGLAGVGGCCGATAEHLRALAGAVADQTGALRG